MATGGAFGTPDLDALLAALRPLSPMPPDERLNPVILRIYGELIERVRRLGPSIPARAIGPLLASLGPGEGRGAFERVLDLVTALPPELCGPPLVEAVLRGTRGARRWGVLGLGRLGYEPGRDAVLAARDYDDLKVRENAELALRMLDARAEQGRRPPADDEGCDPLFEGMRL